MKVFITYTLLLIPLLFAGCIGGSNKYVKINSDPGGAIITIYDKYGKIVDIDSTPANLVFNTRHGYYTDENYKITFETKGYYPYEVDFKPTLFGWYFGDNAFGGYFGLWIKDPETGVMYELSPNEINRNLVSSEVPLTPEELKAAELKANPTPLKLIHWRRPNH